MHCNRYQNSLVRSICDSVLNRSCTCYDYLSYKCITSSCVCVQCQGTLVQFITFLSLQLSSDELVKRLPDIHELLTTYHIPTEVAFALWRIVYASSISVSCRFLPGLWNEWDDKPYTVTHPHFFLSLIVTLCSCHLWRKLHNMKLRLSVCFVAAFFSWAGWAFHISWSKCCLCVWASVCVWMLTKVAQIVTAAHRDL